MAAQPKLISFFLSALLLSPACAAHYVPRAGDGVSVSGERASVRNDRVNVTFGHEPFYTRSASLDQGVTSFRVGIRNLGATPVTVTTDSFLLFDADGTQHSVIAAADLAEAIRGGAECRPNVGWGLGWGSTWGMGGWGHPGFGSAVYYGNDFACDPRVADEVVASSLLPASPLQPGARMTGVVYFKGTIGKTGSLTIDFYLPGSAPLRAAFDREK